MNPGFEADAAGADGSPRQGGAGSVPHASSRLANGDAAGFRPCSGGGLRGRIGAADTKP